VVGVILGESEEETNETLGGGARGAELHTPSLCIGDLVVELGEDIVGGKLFVVLLDDHKHLSGAIEGEEGSLLGQALGGEVDITAEGDAEEGRQLVEAALVRAPGDGEGQWGLLDIGALVAAGAEELRFDVDQLLLGQRRADVEVETLAFQHSEG